MSRAGLRARAVDFFIEPLAPDRSEGAGASYRDPAPPPRPDGGSAPVRVRGSGGVAARARAATRLPFRAAVLGSAAEAPPVAALLANALRSAAGAPAAAVAVWAPGAGTAPVRRPATLGAGRLAARLSARELPAVGRGRLAWLALDDHPVAAARRRPPGGRGARGAARRRRRRSALRGRRGR